MIVEFAQKASHQMQGEPVLIPILHEKKLVVPRTMEVPLEFLLRGPPSPSGKFDNNVKLVPGTKMSTRDWKFENQVRVAISVLAPTVMALVAEAGLISSMGDNG